MARPGSRVTTPWERKLIRKTREKHGAVVIAESGETSASTVNNMCLEGPIVRGKYTFPEGFNFPKETIARVISACKRLGSTEVVEPKRTPPNMPSGPATHTKKYPSEWELDDVPIKALLEEVQRRVKLGDVF